MKKSFAIIVLFALLLTSLTGCTKVPQKPPFQESKPVAPDTVDVKVAGLVGPTSMGMAYMFKESDDGTSINTYKYEILNNPEEVAQKLVDGEFDIAAMPTNIAAAFYNKTGGKIKLVAISALGSLKVVENGETIKSIDDLKGKTVYCSGQGSTDEYVTKYLCPGIKLNFTYAENAELISALIEGKAKLAVLPEPNATTALSKNPNLHIAIDLSDEWTDGAIAMECIAVNTDFLNAHPKAVSNFLIDYGASVKKANANSDAPGVIASFGMVPSEDIARDAIPSCQIVCITGLAMDSKVTPFLDVLYSSNSASIGGQKIDKNFYFVG